MNAPDDKPGSEAPQGAVDPGLPHPPPAPDAPGAAPGPRFEKGQTLDMAELLAIGMEPSAPGRGKDEKGRDEYYEREWLGRVVGDYRIEAELGKGGAGTVFRAVNVRVGSTVALKLLRFAPGQSAERIRRFELEARAAAELNHPNIINVFDFGQVGDLYYLAMEYVEGRPLSELLEAGPLDPLQAVGIAMELCTALKFAHAAGVVHRDLKPSNVLIESSGRAQLMDFGMARRYDGADAKKLTEDGAVMGTAHYMSPEQARGYSRDADSRSDVYSMGAVLYEMVAGKPPFDGETALEIIQQVAADDPPPPRRLRPALDRDLEILILKAMEKEPARRYVSAEALWEDLWRYRGGEPIHARAPSAFYRARKFMGRHRVWAALGALALAGAGAVAVWMPFHDRKVIEQVRTETEQEREAATARELRARLLALETRELGSALGERWRLVHALRLGGRPGDALDALDRLAKEQDAKSPESRAHIALWRALLEMDAGREGDLKEARKLAEDAGSPLLAGLCDLYLATPENLPAPPEHLDAEQRSIWCYHAGRVALARNRPAVARACFAHALDASIESLEARCAALELERLGGE